METKAGRTGPCASCPQSLQWPFLPGQALNPSNHHDNPERSVPLLYGAQGEGRLARNLQGTIRKLETHPRLLREGQPQPQEGLLCPLNLQ